MNEMYKRIEDLCAQNGMNVTEMCRATGVGRGNLTDLKMGRTTVLSSKTLSKIAAYFDVPMDYLLGNTSQSISANNNSVVLSGNVGDNSVNTPITPKLDDLLTEDEQELIRVYRLLSFRQKHDLMSNIYRLEDQIVNPHSCPDPLEQTISNAASRAKAQTPASKRIPYDLER